MMNSEVTWHSKNSQKNIGRKKNRWQGAGIWKFTSNLKTLSGFTLVSQSLRPLEDFNPQKVIAAKKILFPSKKKRCNKNPMSLKPHLVFFSMGVTLTFGHQTTKKIDLKNIRLNRPEYTSISMSFYLSDIFPQILHNFLVSLLCGVHSQHVPNLHLGCFPVISVGISVGQMFGMLSSWPLRSQMDHSCH